MGINTTYIGHVDIAPSLNQAEYDYLSVFPDRILDRGWPDEGLPDRWCGWEPCPHGCCLSWSGREKFNAWTAPLWMQYLIDEFMRREARAWADSEFPAFTFDHRMDGLIIGEQQDNLELFAIRVENNRVTTETLRRGMPLPFESGWDGLFLEDRPWLAKEPRRGRASICLTRAPRRGRRRWSGCPRQGREDGAVKAGREFWAHP